MLTLSPDGLLTTDKRIQLLPYKPRPTLPRPLMTEAEICAAAGGTLILDTESYHNFFLAGFKHAQSGKYIQLTDNFNPQFLSWLLFSFKTVGFNSLNFDLPLLWASYFNRDPQFLKAVTNDLILSGLRSNEIAKKFGFETYKLPERQHVDLFNVCPLKGSLKLYGARLHSPRIQDLPIPEDAILTDDEKKTVVEYNCNDLDVTEQIYKFCKERLELREFMSLEYGEDLMSKSDAQIAEVVIPKEVSKLNKRYVQRPTIEAGTLYKYKVPEYLSYATNQMKDLLERVKKADFIVNDKGKIIPPKILEEPVRIGGSFYSVGIGGLHSKDKCKAYRAENGYKLRDVDVTSYYPNAIINMNLYPIACGPNFIKVYKGFKEERVVAKQTGQFTKDKGLKIFLNGVSGKLSDFYSKMYSPGHTIQMNLTGQLSILMLAEMFECQGIEVISANTDGLTVYYRECEEDKVTYWTRYWENITGFQLEDVQYLGYFARDVNAYFAVKTNGKVKVKGPWSEVGSQSGTQLDTNPNMLICKDAIEAFLSKGMPIEQTVNECEDVRRFVIVQNVVSPGAAFRNEYLGKVVRYVKSKTSRDCIQYVASGNKVANSDNALPLMDLPDSIPSDLDRQFYIDKCIEILYDIGYLVKPRQVSFF